MEDEKFQEALNELAKPKHLSEILKAAGISEETLKQWRALRAAARQLQEPPVMVSGKSPDERMKEHVQAYADKILGGRGRVESEIDWQTFRRDQVEKVVAHWLDQPGLKKDRDGKSPSTPKIIDALHQLLPPSRAKQRELGQEDWRTVWRALWQYFKAGRSEVRDEAGENDAFASAIRNLNWQNPVHVEWIHRLRDAVRGINPDLLSYDDKVAIKSAGFLNTQRDREIWEGLVQILRFSDQESKLLRYPALVRAFRAAAEPWFEFDPETQTLKFKESYETKVKGDLEQAVEELQSQDETVRKLGQQIISDFAKDGFSHRARQAVNAIRKDLPLVHETLAAIDKIDEQAGRSLRSEARVLARPEGVSTIALALAPEGIGMPSSRSEMRQAVHQVVRKKIPAAMVKKALIAAVETVLSDLEFHQGLSGEEYIRLQPWIKQAMAMRSAKIKGFFDEIFPEKGEIALDLHFPKLPADERLLLKMAAKDYAEIFEEYFKGRIERIVLSGGVGDLASEFKAFAITLDQNPGRLLLPNGQQVLPELMVRGRPDRGPQGRVLPVGIEAQDNALPEIEKLNRIAQSMYGAASALLLQTPDEAKKIQSRIVAAMQLDMQYPEGVQLENLIHWTEGYPTVNPTVMQAMVFYEAKKLSEQAA